jgi:hypothetical protein
MQLVLILHFIISFNMAARSALLPEFEDGIGLQRRSMHFMSVPVARTGWFLALGGCLVAFAAAAFGDDALRSMSPGHARFISGIGWTGRNIKSRRIWNKVPR